MRPKKSLTTDEITKKIENAFVPENIDLEISDRSQVNKKIVESLQKKKRTSRPIHWRRLIPVAASFCIILALSIYLPIYLSSSSPIGDSDKKEPNIISTTISFEQLQKDYTNFFIPNHTDGIYSCSLYLDDNNNSEKYLRIFFEDYETTWKEYIVIEENYQFSGIDKFNELTNTAKIKNTDITYKETDFGTFSSFTLDNYTYYFWFRGNSTELMQYLETKLN